LTGRETFDRFSTLVTFLKYLLGDRTPIIVVKIMLIPFMPFKGNLGALARFLYFNRLLISLGDGSYIAKNTILKNANNVKIGKNFSLHEFGYLDGKGGIEIADNVSIAHSCSILSTNHGWENTLLPIKYNPVTENKTTICNDVWIGCGVRILAGVTIGPRSVVAAGAVVTKSLQGNGLYGGIPAKKIKDI